MRIGIDFDRVLFDTDRFKEFLDSEIDGFLDSYPEGRYSPGKHAAKLGIDVGKITSHLEKAGEFLYSDVPELERIDDHKLVLVTRGDRSFQRKKVEESGVEKYFDEVRIVEEEPKCSADIDFLVDDWKKEIERAKVPGMVFDRARHSVEDIVEKVNSLDG